MSRISFKRITPHESRIYDADGDFLGEVYRQPDILNPGEHYYVIALNEDPRGFSRVHERSRIRDVALQWIAGHPYWA